MFSFCLRLVGVSMVPTGFFETLEIIVSHDVARYARYEAAKERSREAFSLWKNLTGNQARLILPYFGWPPKEALDMSDEDAILNARASLTFRGFQGGVPTQKTLDKIKAQIGL